MLHGGSTRTDHSWRYDPRTGLPYGHRRNLAQVGPGRRSARAGFFLLSTGAATVKTLPFAVALVGAYTLAKGFAPGFAHWVIAGALVAVGVYLLRLDRRTRRT